jgi:hypothetical protein
MTSSLPRRLGASLAAAAAGLMLAAWSGAPSSADRPGPAVSQPGAPAAGGAQYAYLKCQGSEVAYFDEGSNSTPETYYFAVSRSKLFKLLSLDKMGSTWSDVCYNNEFYTTHCKFDDEEINVMENQEMEDVSNNFYAIVFYRSHGKIIIDSNHGHRRTHFEGNCTKIGNPRPDIAPPT